MTTAYVLINCELGYEEQIIEELKHLSDVKEAHGTFGAYDILAKVESASKNSKRNNNVENSKNGLCEIYHNAVGDRRSGIRISNRCKGLGNIENLADLGIIKS